VHSLETGQRFVINTADAEVEVKGTRFEVAILERPACADGTRTRVEVFEGVVTVTRPGGQPVYVTAGSDWPHDCRPPARAVVVSRKSFSRHARLALRTDSGPTPSSRAPAARPTEATPPPADPLADIVLPPPSVPSSPAPSASRPPPPRIVRPPESKLVVENDLYEEALKAVKAGDHAKALRRLDELLTRFPDGTLAESAQLERRKLKADEAAHRRPPLDPFEH
jgi:hypothetical protein